MSFRSSFLLVGFIFLALLFLSCSSDQLFEKLDSVKAGIDFENKLTPREDFNIIDYLYFYNGGGVAIGDINGDQLPDIFFSGNQVKNKLYLNKGNLVFDDITEQAGVAGNSSWNTGSVMADVNGDGLLDIYVCAVVGLKNLTGHNELYINNGNGTFTERSADYKVDFESYSSSAAFLDYDLDGDLDMYLLNHAIHTPESFGHANLRLTRNYETGDKLLRNDGNYFTDVSEKAKIFGGINGYGLGVSVSDFNLDGYPDIYVSNDFHEDDYYYINNKDGSFQEVGKKAFTAFSRFSMGSDVSDINHDGFPDLVTLDMLPNDETVLKRSEADETLNSLKLRTKEYGYHYQFSRNMLQVNQGNGQFVEVALLGNTAATDWSWSALFSDFNQDGEQDLFISNGIPKRPNDLDYIKYVSSQEIASAMNSTKLVDQKALALMPSGMAPNFIFKGNGTYVFEDMSNEWLPDEQTCSSATAIGDLDMDGDLDIVVNNVDSRPGIYVNNANESSNYLKIRLNYTKSNHFGLGSRVFSYHNGIMQVKEMYTVRGFQSSSEPIIHFGYGVTDEVDSLKVLWPNGKIQKLEKLQVNQTIVISPDSSAKLFDRTDHNDRNNYFRQIDQSQLGLSFVHVEDNYSDFDRLKLLPYQQSDRGPATAVGDLNNDGLSDVFFGGSKRSPSQIYFQTVNGFAKSRLPEILKDSIKEDVDAVIADFTGDGKSDLFIGTGGADFYNKSSPILDSYYWGSDSGFVFSEIQDYYENAACVRRSDFDNDGDQDLFVGNESVSNDFGKTPKSYLLRNDKGALMPIQKDLFENLGMVTDAVWTDYNEDGQEDLFIIGEWMAPTFLKNNKGVFEVDNVMKAPLNGLWQSVAQYDVDEDGKMDFLLGNWGLNSKFRASSEFPMAMYYSDFDQNGISETIVAIEKSGIYYPLDGLDQLASQIPSLRRKFNSYHSFAGKAIDEVFTKKQLELARKYEVHELASGYLRNMGGYFEFFPFSENLQVAPIMAQLSYDFDFDGKQEVLLAGNYFGVQPFHGRFGSFMGAIVKGGNKILMGNVIGLNFFNQSVRHLSIIDLNERRYLLVTMNNGEAQVYELLKEQ